MEQRIEKIKRALECDATNNEKPCEECPYKKYGLPRCRKIVARDALTLIEDLYDTVRIREHQLKLAIAENEKLKRRKCLRRRRQKSPRS